MKALVQINAVDACLEGLNGPHRAGAIAALKHLHDPKTVDGHFKVLSTSRDESLRREVWTTLIRLYHREGEFTVDSPKWWGTRPDTTGPYYDRQKWSESEQLREGRLVDAITIQEPCIARRSKRGGALDAGPGPLLRARRHRDLPSRRTYCYAGVAQCTFGPRRGYIMGSTTRGEQHA